jgi:hypothetical protein
MKHSVLVLILAILSACSNIESKDNNQHEIFSIPYDPLLTQIKLDTVFVSNTDKTYIEFTDHIVWAKVQGTGFQLNADKKSVFLVASNRTAMDSNLTVRIKDTIYIAPVSYLSETSEDQRLYNVERMLLAKKSITNRPE